MPNSVIEMTTSREVSEDPLSAICRQIMLGWIDHYAQNDHPCPAPAPTKFPKSWFKVETIILQGWIFLRQQLPWSSLHSHIVVKARTITTLRSIILSQDLIENHIPIKFQDAIGISPWLSLEYLWIGSFCIMQEDHLEWESELPTWKTFIVDHGW